MKLFPQLLIFACLFGLVACSSTPEYIPSIAGPLDIRPYEDEFIKLVVDGPNKAQLHIKSTGQFLGIVKVQDSPDPDRIGNYEVELNEAGRKYPSYFNRKSCGKYMAYVPGRGLVCWSYGNKLGGVGKIVYHEPKKEMTT